MFIVYMQYGLAVIVMMRVTTVTATTVTLTTVMATEVRDTFMIIIVTAAVSGLGFDA